MIIDAIRCISEVSPFYINDLHFKVFTKEPFLVIKAYEGGFNFQILIDSIKNGDPELALASIDFWDKFIMIDTVVYKEEFKKKLFEQ